MKRNRFLPAFLAVLLAAAGFAAPCQAKADAKKKAAPAPQVSVSEWRAHYDEAAKLFEEGRLLRAEPAARKALQVAVTGFGRNHRFAAESEYLLGVICLDMGYYDRAEGHLLRALPVFEKTTGPGSLDTASALNGLSVTYFQKGDLKKAESFLRRSIGIREKHYGADHFRLGTSVHNLAGIVRKRGDHDAAEALYRRALALKEKAPDSPNYGLASTLSEFGGFLRDLGRHAEAEETLMRALAVFGKGGRNRPEIVPVLRNLGLLHHFRGNADAADKFLRDALAAARASTGHDSPVTRRAFRDLTDFYRAQGLFEEAARYEAWAAETPSAQGGR